MADKKEGAAVSVNILPSRIYQILSEHTDGDHALPMGELLRLLRTEYGLDKRLHPRRDNGDGTFGATVFTGAAGLKFWALQYVTVCQVLEPLGLRQEIGGILRDGWAKYETMSETVTDARTK